LTHGEIKRGWLSQIGVTAATPLQKRRYGRRGAGGQNLGDENRNKALCMANLHEVEMFYFATVLKT
jgi:hypothetical protein